MTRSRMRAVAATTAAAAVLAAGWAWGRAPLPPVQIVVTEAAQFVPGGVERPGDPAPLPLIVERGGRLFLLNIDNLGAHRITAYDLDDRGEPLFWSHTINAGQAGEVIGVRALAPGRYAFYCGFHSGMDGSLEVLARTIQEGTR
ncbi:MAG: cupredoxin domain-containing protein [Actinomycetota bacterium]